MLVRGNPGLRPCAAFSRPEMKAVLVQAARAFATSTTDRGTTAAAAFLKLLQDKLGTSAVPKTPQYETRASTRSKNALRFPIPQPADEKGERPLFLRREHYPYGFLKAKPSPAEIRTYLRLVLSSTSSAATPIFSTCGAKQEEVLASFYHLSRMAQAAQDQATAQFLLQNLFDENAPSLTTYVVDDANGKQFAQLLNVVDTCLRVLLAKLGSSRVKPAVAAAAHGGIAQLLVFHGHAEKKVEAFSAQNLCFSLHALSKLADVFDGFLHISCALQSESNNFIRLWCTAAATNIDDFSVSELATTGYALGKLAQLTADNYVAPARRSGSADEHAEAVDVPRIGNRKSFPLLRVDTGCRESRRWALAWCTAWGAKKDVSVPASALSGGIQGLGMLYKCGLLNSNASPNLRTCGDLLEANNGARDGALDDRDSDGNTPVAAAVKTFARLFTESGSLSSTLCPAQIVGVLHGFAKLHGCEDVTGSQSTVVAHWIKTFTWQTEPSLHPACKTVSWSAQDLANAIFELGKLATDAEFAGAAISKNSGTSELFQSPLTPDFLVRWQDLTAPELGSLNVRDLVNSMGGFAKCVEAFVRASASARNCHLLREEFLLQWRAAAVTQMRQFSSQALANTLSSLAELVASLDNASEETDGRASEVLRVAFLNDETFAIAWADRFKEVFSSSTDRFSSREQHHDPHLVGSLGAIRKMESAYLPRNRLCASALPAVHEAAVARLADEKVSAAFLLPVLRCYAELYGGKLQQDKPAEEFLEAWTERFQAVSQISTEFSGDALVSVLAAYERCVGGVATTATDFQLQRADAPWSAAPAANCLLSFVPAWARAWKRNEVARRGDRLAIGIGCLERYLGILDGLLLLPRVAAGEKGSGAAAEFDASDPDHHAHNRTVRSAKKMLIHDFCRGWRRAVESTNAASHRCTGGIHGPFPPSAHSAGGQSILASLAKLARRRHHDPMLDVREFSALVSPNFLRRHFLHESQVLRDDAGCQEVKAGATVSLLCSLIELDFLSLRSDGLFLQRMLARMHAALRTGKKQSAFVVHHVAAAWARILDADPISAP